LVLQTIRHRELFFLVRFMCTGKRHYREMSVAAALLFEYALGYGWAKSKQAIKMRCFMTSADRAANHPQVVPNHELDTDRTRVVMVEWR
jgi:hypothetical protein